MFQIKQIRIEDRIEKCVPAAFPASRVGVEGDLKGFHLIGLERAMKSRKRLGFYALNRRTEFGVAEFAKYDTQNTVRLKPSKRICFADQSGKQLNNALQRRFFIMQLGSLALHEHQQKTFPRALGPFPLLAYKPAKHGFWQRLYDAASDFANGVKFLFGFGCS